MKRKFSLATKIAIAAGALYVVSVAWLILDRTPSKSEAWTMAQHYVIDKLKPTKWDFGDVKAHSFQSPDEHVEKLGGGDFRATGFINGQDARGILYKRNFVCDLHFEKGKWACKSVVVQ